MKRPFDLKTAAKAIVISVLFFAVFAAQSANARDIAGVDVPPSVTIKNKVLVLNGAGIRKKLFIKVYVGALYLTMKRTTLGEILSDPGAKRIVMSFLYKEVSAEKLVDAWNEGFSGNNTPDELKALQERINAFNALFTTVRKGDVIRLDYLPEEGTQVWINDTLKGTVQGEDFSRALLKIWLGRKPADAGLKEAMLGSSY